jgi:hypothetical protein
MAGKFPLLVATDVAARGLQIDDLEMKYPGERPQLSSTFIDLELHLCYSYFR